jgi:hypothetical protein
MAAFLGRLFTTVAPMLGRAAAAAPSFLGRMAPVAMQGLSFASQAASNPLFRQVAGKMGVRTTTMDKIQQGLMTGRTVVGAVPGVVRDVGAAASGAKRSLGEIYALAHPK